MPDNRLLKYKDIYIDLGRSYSTSLRDEDNIEKPTLERFMSLSYEESSSSANGLTVELSNAIHTLSPRTYGVTKKRKVAVAAIIADLLSVANAPGEPYLFRPRGAADFTGHRVGFKPCTTTLDALVELGHADQLPSVWCGSKAKGQGRAAGYRPTPSLLELAVRFGITPGNWRSHFTLAPRPARMPHPIIVRAERQYWDDNRKGKQLPLVKTHPKYIAALQQVNRINAYMQSQDISGCNHDGFVRIYNHGDDVGFGYDMGGRLYSIATGVSYQNMRKRQRSNIRINGETIVELDLRASFLSILYGMQGVTLAANDDPYIISGLPRDVVKAWIAMTLGYDSFHAQWSADTILSMQRKGIDVVQQYPIATVRAEVIEMHPILARWRDSPVRWQHLQHTESKAIIDAVDTLGMDHDVAALPLHDALLVPSSKVDIASEVLQRTFRAAVGADPVLTIKDSWG